MALATKELLSVEERRRLASLLVPGLSCSRHSLTGGDRDLSCLNLDLVLTDSGRSAQFVPLLAKAILGIAEEMQAEERRIDRLGFVDNSARGPSALLGCQVALEIETKFPSIIVRPDKRLYVSQVTGAFTTGDRVLFVGDVLTTGQTMARATAICARHQLTVIGGIYIYDRMLHGQVDLREVGIDTESLMNRDRFISEAHDQLKPTEIDALKRGATPEHHDLFRLMAMQI